MKGPYEQHLHEKEITEPDPEPRASGNDIEFGAIVDKKGHPLFLPRLEQMCELIGVEEDDATD